MLSFFYISSLPGRDTFPTFKIVPSPAALSVDVPADAIAAAARELEEVAEC